MTSPIPTSMRGPVRISTTLHRALYETLSTRARQEGRSMSNLIAYLLERALHQDINPPA